MTAKTLSLFTLLALLFSMNINAEQAAPKAPKQPCDTSEHHQFDFWLGDWQVLNKDGVKQGSNKIVSILDGCVISENWQAAQGDFTGKSVNFYDTKLKQWHQTWTDNKGGVLFLNGNLEGNVMVLQGTRPAKDGKPSLHKISYTPQPDGSMEQKWLSSNDDGQNWNELFLGYYHK